MYNDGLGPKITETAGVVETQSAGTPVLDLERYRPYLSDVEVSQEEKDEFLRAMWHIMCSFAYLGFGLDSVQNLFPRSPEIPSPESPIPVECEEQTRTFQIAAHDPAEKGR